jgi:pimeloyl-ACP methyl ester carboxylesterase
VALAAVVFLGGCNPGGDFQPKQYLADTDDGWTLCVMRYAPAKIDDARLPVVLCHGLSYNATFWDLDEEVSLARYLREAGYDVWVPSLRGAGLSTKPPLSRLRQMFMRGDWLTAEGTFTSGGKGLLKTNWTVDDHVNYDVPTVIKMVLHETGKAKLHWIGHSMGGMVMVGHLAKGADPAVASFVALGTPVFVDPPLSAPLALMAKSRGAFEVSNAVVSTNLPALLGAIGGTKAATPIDVLFYNPQDVDDHVIRKLNARATEDISPGQLSQLIDMVATGTFKSADSKSDYTAALGKLTTPALFAVGTVDNLATVGAVKRLYNAWGGEKDYRLFGVVNGQKCDYGHDDVVIGHNARAEVYPAIRQWLDQRSGVLLPVYVP